jgi:hypothetical protein
MKHEVLKGVLIHTSHFGWLLGQTIINSVKVEIDFIKETGSKKNLTMIK